MTENQKKTEFTDKDFMQAYGESAGILDELEGK